MEYMKSSLSFEEQADRLCSRGLLADRAELILRLKAVSYYRLSGYLYPFRIPGKDQFKEGTCLKTIWMRYCFDRRLRGLVLDAIERLEVSIRTKLVCHFSRKYGPFGYANDRNLSKLKIDEYLKWRSGLWEETCRSKEPFKKHFFDSYGDAHKELPLWMLAELMSMGSLLTFFKGVSPELKQAIAEEYGLVDEVLHSWLRSLNAARNLCAHHVRLWNRELGYPPLLPNPKKFPEWHEPQKLNNGRCGILLMICRHLLQLVSPTSRWAERVEALFAEYPEVPMRDMGLPENWRAHPVWHGCSPCAD
ncbi:Abi family protein [Opitutaceae bacterium TAV4]|nr:Abi family protein [Opitutaceae bacterium TAV4]RRJ99574.1 Abi family protein [Opitutaceae bacterium TAV3]